MHENSYGEESEGLGCSFESHFVTAQEIAAYNYSSPWSRRNLSETLRKDGVTPSYMRLLFFTVRSKW